MTDRLLSKLAPRRGRGLVGAACALVALTGPGVTAAAAEAPTDVKGPAPAVPNAAPASATPNATPAPDPTVPAPPRAQPPKDDDEEDDDAPKTQRPATDSDVSPAVPPPAASPQELVTTTPAKPQGPPPAPDLNQIDDGQMGSHQEHWLFGVGVRETFVTGKGYDPFSTDNVLPQFSLDVGRAFYASGPWSFAGLLAWDYGSTKATARGADASLDVHRLSAGAEGRYHLFRRLYVFGRVAPGALRSEAKLHDQVANVDREADAWVFTSDFSVGSALEFAGDARGASTRPRGWIGVDGGYSWAQSSKLDFKANGSDATAPARLEPLNFGDLAVRGAFLRLTARLTY